MAALGRDQLAFAQRQYEEMAPLSRQVTEQQLAAQQQSMTQAKDYYDYMQETYRPVEKGLVSDAQRFNTEAYREQMAREASAAAGRAFNTTQDMSSRALAGRGISMGSGAGLALQQQGNLALAANRSNAMTGARTQAEQLGWARRMDVTGLGRGLAGASSGAYQVANASGSAGLQSAMAPGNQYMAGMGQGASTIGSGLQMQNSALGNVLSNQTSAYNTGVQAEGQMYGAVLGAGAAAY